MAGTGFPAKKASARDFYGVLPRQSDPTTFMPAPTLAAGDFKYSQDGGTLTNLATLPTVTPASGKQVLYPLSGTELNTDRIGVLSSDQAGAEWFDTYFAVELSTVQLQDLPLATDYTAARAAKLDNLSGDAFARLGVPAGASVSADVAAAKVDTAAIKVKTDQLIFTKANELDVNTKSQNGATMQGNGTAGNLWRG